MRASRRHEERSDRARSRDGSGRAAAADDEVGRSGRYAALGQRLCLAGALLGIMGVLSWVLGEPFLRTILSGRPEMKPNTSVGVILVGLAAALRRSVDSGRARRIFTTIVVTLVITVATATLVEYAMQVDLGLQTLLAPLYRGTNPAPSSPPTALALGLLAGGLALFDVGRAAGRRPCELPTLAAGFIGFVALLGIAFGAGRLYRLAYAPVTGVALPTAVALLMIATGMLLMRPGRVMSIILAPGPGGMLLRVFVPAIVLSPMLLQPVVSRALARFGVREPSLIFATFATLITIVGLVLLFVIAARLNRTSAALMTSRERLRTLIQQAPDGILITDLDGRLEEVNVAACDLLGCVQGQLVGKDILDYVPREDMGRMQEVQLRLLQGGIETTEWTLRRPDGSALPVEARAAILPDGRWQWMVRDVGEHKRAEEKLRQAEERLKLALEGAELATWDWNMRTGEVVVNERWAEMRGYRLEEVKPSADLVAEGIHPDDKPRVRAALNDYLAGRVPAFVAEFRARTRTNEWIWLLDRGKVFARDEHGLPTRMAGTALDITARKQAEERLRIAEARSSGILAISADAIVSVDADKRITTFNAGAETTFGYDAAEIIGEPLETLIPPRLRAVFGQDFAAFAAGEEIARRVGKRGAEIVGLRKNGEEFPADASISKLEVDDTRIFTVSLRDMTHQKRLEQRLRRAVQAREDVLGVVAHDLRSPLTTILLEAELIEPMVRERGHEAITAIEQSVGRMDRLIEDLLDVARIEREGLPITPAPLAADRVVAAAAAAHAPTLRSASLEIRLDVQPELPVVWGDADRLRQVFDNLIGNALKFTPAGGRITVGAERKDAEVLFWVADTGPGIAPEDMRHLFDPFWQGREGDERGVGLGLAIAHGIVQAHEGRIWAESRPGQGSTFYFTVPVSREAAKEGEVPQARKGA